VIGCCGNMVIAGGLERQTFEVMAALREAGAACHVIVNTWESGAIVALAERIGASWSTGYYWQPLSRRWWNPARMARMLWDAARTSAGLVRDARAFGATAILIPEYHAALRNWPALLWLRAGGARVIMRLGNAPGHDRLHGRVWRWLLRPLVDTFGCNSRFIAGALLAHGVAEPHVAVVYNAAARRWPAERARPTFDPRRVIYVGQVIPSKGVLELLDAMSALQARGVDAHLEVLGAIDGWEAPAYAGYRDRVRARARQPDLAGRVTFLGHREDVLDRLAQAAVHCCPSRPEQREGLAGVVLEAKEAGVPSVVTPTGSLPELIEHGVDGWVASTPAADALADGLERYLRDPVERNRASAAARQSTARFSRDAFTRGWLTVFDQHPATSR
jgi:glycosyltransferase involved in cell wall biosynthesis